MADVQPESESTDSKEATPAHSQESEAIRIHRAFLAHLRHELRTPLNAVIGYSEMLLEDAEDEGQEDFIPDLQKIGTAGKELLALVNDMGRQITTDILGPGQAFGLLGVLDDRPRATGVQVVEQVVVLTLERQDLLPLLDEYPRLRRNLDELLAARLRRTLAYAQDLAFLDVKGRVATCLLALASAGIFAPHYPDHPVTTALKQAAASLVA